MIQWADGSDNARNIPVRRPASAFFALLRFLLRVLVWAISGEPDAPFVRTPVRYAPLIAEALAIGQNDVVYELGSGDGRFLLVCALHEPGARFVGIERNPLLHLRALLNKRLVGNPRNVELRREDFFGSDLSGATKLYAYLLDPAMQRLQPKLEREFKGTLASRAFPLPRKELANVVALTEKIGAHAQHLLFVYAF